MSGELLPMVANGHYTKSAETPVLNDSNAESPKSKKGESKSKKDQKKIERLKKVASGMGGGPTGELPATGVRFACIIGEGDGTHRLIEISDDLVVTEVSEDIFHRATAKYLTESAGAMYPELRFFKPADLDAILRYFYCEGHTIAEDSIRFVAWQCEASTLCYARLPWRLDEVMPSTKPTPTWDSLMSHMIANQDAFQWWIGSLFDETSDKSQYLYLWGEGGSGKSRVVAFLKRLFGKGATVTLPPQKDNRFWFSTVYRSRVVLLTDVEDYRVVNSAPVKILTGDAELSVEKKGLAPFGAKSNCKLLMCSNHPPGISSDTADARRLIEVEMRAVEEKKSSWIVDNALFQEAPAFLRRCIEVYKGQVESKGQIAFTSVSLSETITERARDNEAEFFTAFDQYLMWDEDLSVSTNAIKCIRDLKSWDFKTYRAFINWFKRQNRQIRYTNPHRKGDIKVRLVPGYFGVGVKPEFRKNFGCETPDQPSWSKRTPSEWVKFVKGLGHNVKAGVAQNGVKIEYGEGLGAGGCVGPAEC